MALLAYNKTISPLVLAAGSPAVTLPAAFSAGARGSAFDVTGELRPDLTMDPVNGVGGGVSAAGYVSLQAQVAADSVEYEWTTLPEYNTATLEVSSASLDASDQSRVIYISPSPVGNDANNGSTPLLAVATLTRAQQLKAVGWYKNCHLIFGAEIYTLSPDDIKFFNAPTSNSASPETWIGTALDQFGSRSVTGVVVGNGIVGSSISDSAVATFRTGAIASITVAAGAGQARIMTVTGMTGLTSADVGKNFFFGLATNPGNNGTFMMASFISATSATFFNAQSVVEASALIYWQDSWRGSFLRFTMTPTITCIAVASLVNNDNFTVTGNFNIPTVFEYKVTGGYTPVAGRVTIDVSALGDPSATGVAVATAMAISAVSGLSASSVTTVVSVVPSPGPGVVGLAEAVANAGFLVNDLARRRAFPVVSNGVASTASVTVAGVVTAGDTITINDGTNVATTLAWVAAAPGPLDVLIGVDNSANAANLRTVINSIAPTSLRVRATNTAGSAVVQLFNMIPGALGNTATPTKTGVWTPAIVLFSAGISVGGGVQLGAGTPTTTFTIQQQFPIVGVTASVGNTFVIEKAGTVFQYAFPFSMRGSGLPKLGLQNIKFRATAPTASIEWFQFSAYTDRVEFDLNGTSFTPTFYSVLGHTGADAWLKDKNVPFTGLGSDFSAMYIHNGTVNMQIFSMTQGAWIVLDQVAFNAQVMALLNSRMNCQRSTLQILGNALSGNILIPIIDGTLLSTDNGITVDQMCEANIGTSAVGGLVKNAGAIGILFRNGTQGRIGPVGGSGNGGAGISVDRRSGATIDTSGANTTLITGNPGNLLFGHETPSPNYRTYEDVRTLDATGTRGFQDTHLNRVDA